ncbi:hypothetical protein [Aidingimonas lacisalsi]|uniref:hypothetical protein n=1 Tax=Aidingimonas lacisalsi TaxID=2604086 RepID=UPI0011D19A13|nr:hypothetical protein [Aidingimonas lacisalsi]
MATPVASMLARCRVPGIGIALFLMPFIATAHPHGWVDLQVTITTIGIRPCSGGVLLLGLLESPITDQPTPGNPLLD